MKDFALLIVVLVVLIYGYFLMGKLDRCLEEDQSQKLSSGSKLRIGFETPVIIDSIADLLERGAHHDGGRRNVGILLNGQGEQSDDAQNDNRNGDD